MNINKFFLDVKPHVLVILAFFMVGYLYYIKTFNGFSHKEDDVTQGLLKGTEIRKYTDKDGEFPGWTNSIFSGMPSTLIQGKVSGNQIKSWNYLSPVSQTSYPFKILFLSFIGFYLLMNAFKIKPLYGALAAIAYGFASYSISSVEAAHYTKVQAMALMPAVLASLHWLFSGRYFLGGVTLAFNMALQIYYFHYQITFYTIICLLVLGLYYLISLSSEKKIKQLIIATLISIFSVGAGVLCNITKIKTTSNFAENTMRGGNDMVKADISLKQKETGKNGLDRDYAFSWSYSMAETFTLLIPDFFGGSSREKLSKSSKFYEVTQNDEAIDEGLPMYHGELTYTSGPIYIGAIIIFLFVIGMIVVKDQIKWALLLLTLISFILGWGKHFSVVNDFLFDHLPYFNKFRTPMMAFCIAQVTIPLLGFLGIRQIYENWKGQNKTNKKSIKHADTVKVIKNHEAFNYWSNVKMAYFIVGGFCLLMALIGPVLVDMSGPVDAQYKQSGNNEIIEVFRQDRAMLLRKDAFRSFVYISIAFAFFWAWFTNKIQRNVAIGLIAAFACFDLIGVDWRYLSWDDFKLEKGSVALRDPDFSDKQIMADKDIHFRVFDLTNDPFNDNEGAAFHKMIGGYDPAKLSRYQDIISEILSKQQYQDQGLDMLNCKYLIGTDSAKNRGVIPRTSNNGNAWFVKRLTPAKNAALEMNLLKSTDNKTEATFNSDFEANKSLGSETFEMDSSVGVSLLNYHPDTMNYLSSNTNNGFLVFSEIYYDNWKATLDGKQVKLFKVDYTLRGMKIPPGKHKITMYFDKGKNTTDYIERYMSLSILFLMGVLIALWIKTYFTGMKEA